MPPWRKTVFGGKRQGNEKGVIGKKGGRYKEDPRTMW